MKKITYVVIVFFVILSICVANLKILKRLYIKYDIERDAVKLLNNLDYNTKYFKNSIKMLKFIKNEEKSKYDITKDIEDYIYKINKCYRMKIYNEKYKEFEHKNDYISKEFNYIDVYGLDPNGCEYIVKNLTKEQISNYNQNNLRVELIQELEKKFSHIDNRWWIECDEESTIELPYNVYAVFNPGIKEINNDIKKIIKIKLICQLSDLLNEKKDTFRLPYEITYIDTKSKKHINYDELEVVKSKILNKDEYTYNFRFSLYRMFCNTFYPASLVFNQYDYDCSAAQRTKFDTPDPSTVLDHWDVRIIEKFKKYSDQPALQVDYMADGSINAYIRLYLPIEKDGVVINEYKKRRLPYNDNIPIEKLMEKYLSDNEQFTADENFLKSGKALYEYETLIID